LGRGYPYRSISPCVWYEIMKFFHRKKHTPRCTAVILAAGNASRMNGTDKIFTLLDETPVLVHSLRAFQNCQMIDDMIVVAREGTLTRVAELCTKYGISKVTKVTSGGETRLHSVANGVAYVPSNSDLIAIHDGARPLVSNDVICDTIRLAAEKSAAEPGVPVKDTVKIVENGVVADTPNRKTLFNIQTPQIFQADLIKCAIQNAIQQNLSVTDDAMAVEAIGGVVWISKGDYRNMKITTPEDLLIAKTLLKAGAVVK